MKSSAWYKVLNYWCNIKTPLGSGLTIPYLIGIEREYGRGLDFGIPELLTEFNSLEEDDFVISIRKCQNINMDVCCLDKLKDEEKAYYKRFESLYLVVGRYDDFISFKKFQKVVESE